jgi:hypothetical protein
MTCKTIQTLLADYSARRLAPAEADGVRRHLDGCAACDLFSREEAALARGLERLSLVEPSADLWGRVAAGLDAPETRPRLAWWADWRRSVAALATGVAATAGLIAYTHFNAPRVNPPGSGVRSSVIATAGSRANPFPNTGVNPSLDDPMADQMDSLFAVVDQATQPGAIH